MAETNTNLPVVHDKRKRKKSFLKNARKYAKKGHYGRGSNLDADTYQYFIRIMEAYREGFEDEEAKSIFVNNVFEQTTDQEINCSCNQVGCRVIELLLPFANNAVVERYMKAFSDEMRPLCSDRFASHVLEALVSHTTKVSLNEGAERDFREKCKLFTLKVSKFLLNNLEDYLWDTYGNHIVRTCLENLAQIPKENPENNQMKPTEVKISVKLELPEEYTETVKDYGERVISWPQFNDLPNAEVTSGFLQVLLRCLKEVNRKLLKQYMEKLFGDTFAPKDDKDVPINNLPNVFLSKPAMMVLETALQVSKGKMFTKIYTSCFSGRLVKLAVTRNTNFSIQKLIVNCKNKSEFEAIFDELSNNLKEIMESGHTGIIWALGEGCKRLGTKQGSFVQNLMNSLNCLEPEENQNYFPLCLARCKSYNSSIKMSNDNLQKEKLNIHGTLLLQLILEFNKPIKIVNSLLNMDTNNLKDLFSNTKGSHIVDSYVQSTFVGEKSREKIIRKMKGTYQELASTKYGSRSFEALWNAAHIKSRLAIMEELSYKDGSWSNSEHGKIIASKVHLTLFKRNKEDWKNSINKANKTEDLFADIL